MMIHRLYDNTIEIETIEATHRYKKAGEFKTGVTTIVGMLNKPDLISWAAREATKSLAKGIEDHILHYGGFDADVLKELTEKAKKAHVLKADVGKNTGTIVHELAAKRLLEQPFGIIPKEARYAMQQLEKFLKEHKVEVIKVERVVYSSGYDFCGTFDLLAKVDGVVILIDLKTSNRSLAAPRGAYADNFFQLGGYFQAYQEELSFLHSAKLGLPGLEYAFPEEIAILSLPKEKGQYCLTLSGDVNFTPHTMAARFVALQAIYKTHKKLSREIKNLK